MPGGSEAESLPSSAQAPRNRTSSDPIASIVDGVRDLADSPGESRGSDRGGSPGRVNRAIAAPVTAAATIGPTMMPMPSTRREDDKPGERGQHPDGRGVHPTNPESPTRSVVGVCVVHAPSLLLESTA